MNAKTKRAAALALSLLLIISLLAGCDGSASPSSSPAQSPSSSASPAASPSSSAAASANPSTPPDTDLPYSAPGVLPIVTEPITITFMINNQCMAVMEDYSQKDFMPLVTELTNVNIEWNHNTMDNGLALLVAARDYPDVMLSNWNFYSGGAPGAIEDGVILSLNDMIADQAIYLNEYFDEYPHLRPFITTINGDIPGFPMNLPDQGYSWTDVGPSINMTWLNELGLPKPETLDEWETVLAGFKQNHPDGYPMISLEPYTDLGFVQMIFFAYGVDTRFYPKDGVIRYGPFEPGFRPALERLAKWYAEGWLDNECIVDDYTSHTDKFQNRPTGSAFYNVNLNQTTGCQWEGVQYPTLNKGDKFAKVTTGSGMAQDVYSISTTNKYPVETVKWLDFFYGEEGGILANYGVEGTAWEWKDGQRAFKPLILANPDGLNLSEALQTYTVLNHGWFKIYRHDANNARRSKESVEMLMGWNVYVDPGPECKSALIVRLTSDEMAERSRINGDLTTFYREMMVSFVTGRTPINDETYENYVTQLKRMGAESLRLLEQLNYDRFFGK